MMFFLAHGYRVIAHDRRGHGRSTQTFSGNEMDTYAADVAELVAALDLRNAIHVGHSTGGGEVARYVTQHGDGRVAKAVLISAVPPLMVKTAANPGGLPKDVFDGFQAQLVANRAQFYYDVPAGPFYGYNRLSRRPLIANAITPPASMAACGRNALHSEAAAGAAAVPVPNFIARDRCGAEVALRGSVLPELAS
jgi:pimeloyl-ACP methyl ester carboxylesterase